MYCVSNIANAPQGGLGFMSPTNLSREIWRGWGPDATTQHDFLDFNQPDSGTRLSPIIGSEWGVFNDIGEIEF